MIFHDTEKYREVSAPPLLIMKKTRTQIGKEYFVNGVTPYTITAPTLQVNYFKQFTAKTVVMADGTTHTKRGGNAKFIRKEVWEKLENENKAHIEAIGVQPFCIWADAHTLSVSDEVITVTRDANNKVTYYQYGYDAFNTICVKNLDEARKIENDNGLFGGLYVVDYSTKRVHQLIVKNNDKVRLERVMNTYTTGIPWLTRGVAGGQTFKRKEIWGGMLDTTNFRASENGY